VLLLVTAFQLARHAIGSLREKRTLREKRSRVERRA
jgi:hypothetical protein